MLQERKHSVAWVAKQGAAEQPRHNIPRAIARIKPRKKKKLNRKRHPPYSPTSSPTVSYPLHLKRHLISDRVFWLCSGGGGVGMKGRVDDLGL